MIHTKPIDADLVIDLIAQDLRVTADDLRSKARIDPLPMARALITHALRSCTEMSYPDIGWALDRSNHSTVKTAEDRLLRGQYDRLIQSFIPQAADALDYVRWVCQRASERSQISESSSCPEPYDADSLPKAGSQLTYAMESPASTAPSPSGPSAAELDYPIGTKRTPPESTAESSNSSSTSSPSRKTA